MDLRIQTNPALINADRMYQQQKSQSNSAVQGEEPNFLQTLAEKEDELLVSTTRDEVLSLPEIATLHVLFGSERPDDSGMYGRNNTTQIYKGHLLDVAG